MTAPEHYREAENHLGYAMGEAIHSREASEVNLAAAQVHATLALAAAAALPAVQRYWGGEDEDRRWSQVLS